jgi:hypothetical protein
MKKDIFLLRSEYRKYYLFTATIIVRTLVNIHTGSVLLTTKPICSINLCIWHVE